jgi:hypothetical protein
MSNFIKSESHPKVQRKYTKRTPRKTKQKGNKEPQKPTTITTTQPPILTLETQHNYKKTPPKTQPKPKKTDKALFPLPQLEPSKLMEHSKFLSSQLRFVPCLEGVAKTS